MRTTTAVRSRLFGVVGAAALLVAACGSDDSGSSDGAPASESADQSDDEEFGEALGEALGAGGGGVLVFDGEEIAIASVICRLDEDNFDVGTVSDNGFRVLISLGSNDIGVQVLDSDFVQWFPQDVNGDEAQRDGGTFTSDVTPYFNNSDDRIVQASFTVDCP